MPERPLAVAVRVQGSSRWLGLTALAGIALLLVSCGGGNGGAAAARSTGPSVTPTPSTQVSTTARPTTTTTRPALPITPIAWTPCNGDLQCGTLIVPLDYNRPEGATIGIAVERHVAEEPADRIGSLVINPGGPGVSGIDDFPNELSALTPKLLDDFDIVTFDPRGVQRSDPVTCGTNSDSTLGPLPDPVPQSAVAQNAIIANMRQFAADCEKESGAILPYVGTVDVARDLDRLRAALGDSRLTYMGQSYGTLLGETYAQLFPSRIRAMVLDSVIDPALPTNEMVMQQAEGFEDVLDSFFAWCAAAASCQWRPSGDPATALLAQLARSETNPVPAGAGRVAGPGELYNALLDGLYSESEWPALGAALASDADGNGADVVAMSDGYSMDGSTNGAEVADAVDCLDHPVSTDVATYAHLAAQFGVSAPVFGPLLAWGEAACAVWPIAPTRTPAPVIAPGSPPILVIGTTNDPATPYAWAVSVAGQLSHGNLLTVDGSDHVSYFYSSCVRAYVQTYLVNLTTPPAGATCSD